MLGRHTVTITMYVVSFDRSRLPVSQDNDGSHSALSSLAQPPQAHETITGARAHTLLIASAAPQDQRSGDARQAFLEQGRLLTTRHVPRGGHLAHERRRARGGHPRILSSEQQPTAAHQPPSCLGCLPKASVANGAGAPVFFVASSESKVVSATATENDGPSDMEALYAGLSAAGAGALWVEVVVRDEGGTPIRLTSWAKSSVTSSIKRAGAWGEGWLSGDSVLRGDGLAAATFAQFFLLSLLPLETFHTFLGSC